MENIQLTIAVDDKIWQIKECKEENPTRNVYTALKPNGSECECVIYSINDQNNYISQFVFDIDDYGSHLPIFPIIFYYYCDSLLYIFRDILEIRDVNPKLLTKQIMNLIKFCIIYEYGFTILNLEGVMYAFDKYFIPNITVFKRIHLTIY